MIVSKITKSKSGIGYGLVVIKPDTYISPAPLVVFLHGSGEVYGNGTEDDNITRLANAIPSQLKAAVDKYKFIAVCPQTPYVWNMGEVNSALQWADTNLTYDKTRRYLTGLSLGAGGVIFFLKSSAANAKLFSAASPIATTRQYTGDAQYLVDAQVSMWLFHNLDDTNSGTPVSATNEVYDDIVKHSPKILPTKTLFNRSGHGGWGEAYDPNTPPIAPGGQGFTNATITLWDWFLMNSESKRVPVPSSTPPVSILTSKASLGNIAEVPIISDSSNFTVIDPKIYLNGKLSQNYVSATWAVFSVPLGVNPYAINVKGGGWITASTTLPKDGTYVFELTTGANGNLAKSYVTVTYQSGTTPPPPVKQLLQKVFITKNDNYVYVYDDGSTETKSS